MKLNHLKLFAELNKYDSFNKASEDLYISHQALSQMISSLENEFQTQLIKRSANGITFTEDGIYLMKKTNEIMCLLEGTKLQLKSNYLKKQSNKVVLYTDCITNTHIIPKFLPYFNRYYSFINFDIIVDKNISDNAFCFTKQFESFPTNLNNMQDTFGIFSFFSTEIPKLNLSEKMTHSLLTANEIFLATKRNPMPTDVDIFILNERELGRHSTILEYLSYNRIIYVKSQRQCFLALKDDDTATISFKQNHYIDSFNVNLSSFSPPLFLYTYIIGSDFNSEFICTLQTLLKQFFKN